MLFPPLRPFFIFLHDWVKLALVLCIVSDRNAIIESSHENDSKGNDTYVPDRTPSSSPRKPYESWRRTEPRRPRLQISWRDWAISKGNSAWFLYQVRMGVTCKHGIIEHTHKYLTESRPFSGPSDHGPRPATAGQRLHYEERHPQEWAPFHELIPWLAQYLLL